MLPNQAIVDLLQQQLAVRREKLAECEAIDAPCLDNPAASRDQKLHRLVLELVRKREQTYLDWLQDAIELLQDGSAV